jgi:hypothetical protein
MDTRVVLINNLSSLLGKSEGRRHAWRNKGITPVTMLFFLNGAKE